MAAEWQEFQSTPPAEARGDTSCARAGPSSSGSVSIHSPRRSEGRPDECILPQRPGIDVSIHSPRRSEGRQLPAVRLFIQERGFNPLPPPKRGETCHRLACSARARLSFNPLPPPKRGETRQSRVRNAAADTGGFNPLPPPKRGETAARDDHRGRPPMMWFQSTPPAEARGDDVALVSIHSPRRSEGRRRPLDDCPASCESFNPLPPPKRGETSVVGLACHRHADRVSIHSPRRSEGRPRPGAHSKQAPNVSIHSPRRSEGRQTIGAASGAHRHSFNPLPPPKRGETTGRSYRP